MNSTQSFEADSDGGDGRSSCTLLCLMAAVACIYCVLLCVHTWVCACVAFLSSLNAFPLLCCWHDVHVEARPFCSCVLLFINIASATQERSVSLCVRAAGQKWGRVVSKKWCVLLDPFLDKITQGAATWCPLHRSVSPITPSIISFSISLHMDCALASSPSPSISILPFCPLSLFLYLSVSALHTGSTYYGTVISACDRKGQVRSACFFALLTPPCKKMQPGESNRDAIGDTAHVWH